MPSIIPGKTPFEFQWKLQNIRANKIIYVIGDSRVDWGFGDRLFTRLIQPLHPQNIEGFNAGLSAGSTRKIVEFIIENHKGKEAGILVLNFSPAGFFHFNTSPGKALGKIKLQDFLDHRISLYLPEIFYSFGRGWKNLYFHFYQYFQNGYTLQFGWFSRKLHPEGFVSAVGGYNTGLNNVPDVGYYTNLFNRFSANIDFYRGEKEKLIHVLKEAMTVGWDVLLIRLPIGTEMRKIERRLPAELQPEEISRRLNILFFDYDSDPKTSDLPSDESHLLPESGRIISQVLAQDIASYLNSDFQHKKPAKQDALVKLKAEITVRPATIMDKTGIFDVHSMSIESLKATPFYKEESIDAWLNSISINAYDSILFSRDMVVAEIEETIVGFGQIDVKSGIIDSFHTHVSFLSDDVRKKMLQVLETIAVEHGISRLTLFSTLDAVSFFEKNSYRIHEIKTFRFPNSLELKFAVLTKTIP